MHITLETDYAVRIVDCVARSDKRIGSQAIADSTGVTLRFALKILRKLVASEILCSYKGTAGGYELNRKPENISLYDILVTIEGPYNFSRCLDQDHVCVRNHQDECAYHKIFRHLSEEVREELQAITIATTTAPNFDIAQIS